VGFSILGISRAALVLVVAVSNRDTLNMDPLALKLLAIIALIPAAYLFYSVKRYFGFKRAFGIDHFDERNGRCRRCEKESSGSRATACTCLDSSCSGFRASGSRR
jgi:hypothetical protein